jgi:hypothetical protein
LKLKQKAKNNIGQAYSRLTTCHALRGETETFHWKKSYQLIFENGNRVGRKFMGIWQGVAMDFLKYRYTLRLYALWAVIPETALQLF